MLYYFLSVLSVDLALFYLILHYRGRAAPACAPVEPSPTKRGFIVTQSTVTPPSPPSPPPSDQKNLNLTVTEKELKNQQSPPMNA